MTSYLQLKTELNDALKKLIDSSTKWAPDQVKHLKELQEQLWQFCRTIESEPLTPAFHKRLKDFWTSTGAVPVAKARILMSRMMDREKKDSAPDVRAAPAAPSAVEVKSIAAAPAAPPPVEVKSTSPSLALLTIYVRLKQSINDILPSYSPSKKWDWEYHSLQTLINNKMKQIEDKYADPVARFACLVDYWQTQVEGANRRYNMPLISQKIKQLNLELLYEELKSVIYKEFEGLLRLASASQDLINMVFEPLTTIFENVKEYLAQLEKTTKPDERYDVLKTYWQTAGHYFFRPAYMQLKVPKENQDAVEKMILELTWESMLYRPKQ